MKVIIAGMVPTLREMLDQANIKRIPGKMGSHFALMAPYGVFQASDREFYIGVSSDIMWQKLCEAAGRKDLAADTRFTRNAHRLANRAALHDELAKLFAAKPAQHWIDIALRLGIPNSMVRDLAEVAQDEHLAARGLLYDSGIEGVRTVGTPFKMSLTPGTASKRAPALDEDREGILKRIKPA